MNERSVDVAFVGRYRRCDHASYHARKRFGLLVELASSLAESGYKVRIIGSGWQDCEYDLSADVEICDVPHHQTPNLFRSSRIVCSVSAQEGGPVSFLEGLASGCLMVSIGTGFPSEFYSGQDGVVLMPLCATPQDWLKELKYRLDGLIDQPAFQTQRRDDFLRQCEFDVLADRYLRLCFG
jgi:glycosyltransferase involved in cell wall biosynthesis